MRILWHSNAPWTGTGYGQQTGVFAPRLASLGHEVAISSFWGLNGTQIQWSGLTVLPGGTDPYGNDVLPNRVDTHIGSDKGVVITLCDVWVLDPAVFATAPTACWTPVDCSPLSVRDREWFAKSNAVPIAMSRYGEKTMRDAGLAPLYVPHAIDTQVFAPDEDRDALRDALGVPHDTFIVGMNAANKGQDPSRKAFCNQLEAFARLHRKHKDTLFFAHTQIAHQWGIDLIPLVNDLGIADAVMFCDQDAYTSGLLNQSYLAAFYNVCDIVTNASYGEGFGLPIIEAQACGTPVVVTECSSMPELCGSGWRVGGDRYWNPAHEAWWVSPSVDEIARSYRKAYDGQAAKMRIKAREFAVSYDADVVLHEYWKPALEVLENGIEQINKDRG